MRRLQQLVKQRRINGSVFEQQRQTFVGAVEALVAAGADNHITLFLEIQ